MRRGLIGLVAAAALLVLPASAAASFQEFYSGPVAGGVNNAGVEFHAKFHSKRAFRKGKPPSKVVDFGWFNVPVPPSCFDSSDAPSGFDMSVNDRGRFHGTFSVPQTNRTAKITGQFKRHNKKVDGNASASKARSRAAARAPTTGTLDWAAHHGTGE